MAISQTIFAVGTGNYSKDVVVGEVDKTNSGEQNVVAPESGIARIELGSAATAAIIILPIAFFLALLVKYISNKKQTSNSIPIERKK